MPEFIIELVEASTAMPPQQSPAAGGGAGGGSAHTPGGSGARQQQPITKTQIRPPPVPPQALRDFSSAQLSAASSASLPAGAAMASTASSVSAGPPVQTPVPPPVVPVQQTPIPAPTIPLVQETPVPAPSIPVFTGTGSSSAASSFASPVSAGSLPRVGTILKTAGVASSKAAGKVPSARVPPRAGARAPRPKTTISTTPSTLPQQTAQAQQQAQHQQKQPAPEHQQHPRSWSPPRPPISPVLPAAELPHLAPTATGSGTYYRPNFASGRPVLRHTEAARAAAAANAAGSSAVVEDDPTAAAAAAGGLPPAPMPIEFSSNPDVIALQNTIAILQLQKKRATADIKTLQDAKEAILANPMAFVQQLQGIDSSSRRPSAEAVPETIKGKAKRKTTTSDAPKTNNEHSSGDGVSDDSAGDSDSSMEDAADEADKPQEANGSPGQSGDAAGGAAQPQAQPPSQQACVPNLRDLPKPQNVVRMPPINWDKYAVIGDGLERLHAEQLRRPPTGAPAVASIVGNDPPAAAAQGVTPVATPPAATDGSGLQAVYSFQSSEAGAAPLAPEYRGIAAPYSIMQDRLPPAGPSATPAAATATASPTAAATAAAAAARRSRPPVPKH